MSAASSPGGLVGASHAVRVQVTFHAVDERHAQTVAAKLIDSAHQIANLPECECDVDVSVEASPLATSPHGGSSAPMGSSDAPPRGRPPKS